MIHEITAFLAPGLLHDLGESQNDDIKEAPDDESEGAAVDGEYDGVS